MLSVFASVGKIVWFHTVLTYFIDMWVFDSLPYKYTVIGSLVTPLLLGAGTIEMICPILDIGQQVLHILLVNFGEPQCCLCLCLCYEVGEVSAPRVKPAHKEYIVIFLEGGSNNSSISWSSS